MACGLLAGLCVHASAPYLLPADVTTGMPALMSCWAASLSAVERGPPCAEGGVGQVHQSARVGSSWTPFTASALPPRLL